MRLHHSTATVRRIVRRIVRRSLPWLLVVVLLLPAGAAAQVIEPPPRPEPIPILANATLAEYTTEITLDGVLAGVRVTQVFRNDTTRPIEGTYIFPLPRDAAVSNFQMTVDGQVLEGQLMAQDEARTIYESIVRSQRDPALLEYLGGGLFQARIFPIPPGEIRTIQLRYSQVLARENGLFRFTHPLRTQSYSSAPVETLTLTAELRNQPGLRTIYSPAFDLAVERHDDSSATVRIQLEDARPAQDFDLYFGAAESAVGANVLTYNPAAEDGYFVLLAAPGVEAPAAEIIRRDMLLVLDISGSMEGEKIEQARQAAHFLVDRLRPEDRFNLILFNDGPRSWQPAPVPMDEEGRAAAHDWIDDVTAGGSTDINRALLEALAQLDDAAERPAYILFLTDGQPTQGETDPQRILANALANRPAEQSVRLFTFGLGYDVNTVLLDSLSQDLGGRSRYVRPAERVDEAVSSFYASVQTPVLADLSLEFQGDVTIQELYPDSLPDLFAGQQLVVAGRYTAEGPAPVTLILRGAVNGEPVLHLFPALHFAADGGDPNIAKLWATRKVGSLLAQVRRDGADPELIQTIQELSARFGIMTPYSAYLVKEPGMVVSAAGHAAPDIIGNRMDLDSLAQPFSPLPPALYDSGPEIAPLSRASGAAAVDLSMRLNTMQRAESVSAQTEAMVRHVAGKTFVRRDLPVAPVGEEPDPTVTDTVTVWVDAAYDEKTEPVVVEFGSDRYFALAADPTVARWLAVASELILVLDDGQVLRITTGEG